MICIEYYFRKATIDDFDFIFDLKKKNFKKYIEKYFEWNEEERKEMYYNTLKNYLGEYNIIVVNNKDVGVFAVDESNKGESYISEISLNKEYQNKGIGTDILNNLLIKNKQEGLKTKLKVFKITLPRNYMKDQAFLFMEKMNRTIRWKKYRIKYIIFQKFLYKIYRTNYKNKITLNFEILKFIKL